MKSDFVQAAIGGLAQVCASSFSPVHFQFWTWPAGAFCHSHVAAVPAPPRAPAQFSGTQPAAVWGLWSETKNKNKVEHLCTNIEKNKARIKYESWAIKSQTQLSCATKHSHLWKKYEQVEWRKWIYLGFCGSNPRLHGVSADCRGRFVFGCAEVFAYACMCTCVRVRLCNVCLPAAL